MISDYLKTYSNYYLSRYTVTKKKFEEILKKKINKDFFQNKITEDQKNEFLLEIQSIIEYFKRIGMFNEERLLEITFQNYTNRGYSQKKISYKLKEAKFKLCLVSPELQGHSYKKVDHLKNEIKKMKINFDAVCTKNPNLWNG